MKTLQVLSMILAFGIGQAIAIHAAELKITASDAAADDWFGASISINGDYIVVGAKLNDDNGTDSGSVYIFVRNGNTWIQQQKLTASDAAEGDLFGEAVSIDGGTVIVGNPQDDDGGTNSGSAYIFVRSGDIWTEQAKLTASDAATEDYFGGAVSISADIAIVGARLDDHAGEVNAGSAYIFVRNGNIWTEQAKLTANDASMSSWFGGSVSTDGDTAIVGAYDYNPEFTSGAAYIFARSGDTWIEQQKLTASDAAQDDWFGYSVSISGDTAIVGAEWTDNAGTNSGSAYIFVRSGDTWFQQQKLIASDAAEYNNFGHSVSINGDVAIVGAPLNSETGTNSGAAYIFVRSGNTWIEQQKLTASDTAVEDQFGIATSISESFAVVGAWQDDDGGNRSGSAYIYSDTTPPAAVVDLVMSDFTTPPITLNWTAPGDDGNVGTASLYDIRYSTSPINEGSFASAIQVQGEPLPKPAGTVEIFTVPSLPPSSIYYFAMKTADEVPNWSPFAIDNKPAPTLTSISPSRGYVTGEIYITLIGANFQPNATVSIGGKPATDVVFVNSTTITAKTPKGTAGAVNVVVNNPDGQSVTLLNEFTYLSTSSISISQSFIDFSLVKIGRTAKKMLEIQNKGDIPLDITAFDLGDAAFSVSENSLTIAPSENHEVVISYTPTDESEANTTLTIQSNDAEKPTITVYLRGCGVINQSLSFERDFLSLRKGQTQTVNLFANGLPKISGFEITFRYPTDLLQIDSIQSGSFLSDAGQIFDKGPELSTTDDYTTASYKVALYEYISLPEGNGVFIRLTIKGLKSGIALLEIVDLTASGQNSSPLFISTSPLTVSVSKIYGDVNLDGIVNAYDAVLILQYIVNLISLNYEQQQAAEVDGLPPITAIDASYVLQYTIGAIDEFPIETGQTPAIANLGVEESRLTLPRLKVKKADTLLVPICLEQNRGNLFGANFTLNFDSKVLRFVALSSSPLTKDYHLTYNPKPGEIHIALAGVKSITEGGVLLFVQFEPINMPLITPLTLSNIRLNAHQIDTVVQGSIEVLPKTSALLQNYPNPFNPETWIPYQLSRDADVTINIYNIKGQLIQQIYLGRKQAGYYSDKAEAAYWDGKNTAGEKVASGIYFYQLQSGNFRATRRMMIVK